MISHCFCSLERQRQRGKNTRKRTGEGLTKQKQFTKTRRAKKEEDRLDSAVKIPKFNWAPPHSNEYCNAIVDINDAYRKMLIIGEAQKVFRDQVCPMLTAKTKEEFKKAQKIITDKYRNYMKTNKATLSNFRLKTEFLPHPRKFGSGSNQRLPTQREILTKEKILTFEHYMASLNVFMCKECKECHIETIPATSDLTYVCKSCTKRKDPNYYLRQNLHPIWFLVDDEGNYVLDDKGNKVVQYHIPEVLRCLSMYEKLLIRRCANFVPSVHLKNGIFGLKGHCVTFPQDVTEMCDELPQRKETLVTFIRNIGNKSSDSIFPTSLTVNRLKVINALKWLQKHNPFYKNITIKESNLDWMKGAEEVNMVIDGVVLNMKESSRSKMKESEEEYVATAHSSSIDGDDDTLPIRTVQANRPVTVPSGRQAKQIKELVDIAHKTNQTSKIMNFPPIDHDAAIS